MDIRNGLCMMEHPALASLQRNGLGMAEHLLTRGKGKLIHHLYLLCLVGIVLDFRLDEHRVANGVIPDMNAKRLDANSIRFD